MVDEYLKMSQSFKYVKSKHQGLIDQINKFTFSQDNICNDLKAEVIRLKTKNKRVNANYLRLLIENQKLSILVYTWNNSSISL